MAAEAIAHVVLEQKLLLAVIKLAGELLLMVICKESVGKKLPFISKLHIKSI